ncbi:MAG: TMEM165/GDT1 family protein [Geodermatophilaceae bacterium]|nr:TMEM165/GDT1 family protein [Geodermatophilaceae bacterium]
MIFSVVFTAFVLVAPVELPDKTMFATLMLASRFRPLPVLTGVGAAFALQTAIAVAAGSLLSLLPREWVALGVAVLFAVGAVVLWRSAGEAVATGVAGEAGVAGEGAKQTQDKDWAAWRIALASFGITFLAEWGDLSQLATAGLAARYDAPLSVFVGAFAALLLIASLAVFVGSKLVTRLPLRLVRRTAAVLFAAFAVLATYEAVTAFTS